MAWIRTIEPGAATGLLRRLYRAAVARAGKVYNVIRLQSVRPEVLRASTRLYLEVMRSSRSPLSRAQREMIATAVSRANGCHYWTEAHGADLRDEVQERPDGERLVAAVKTDYRQADLSAADRRMLDFAVKLTRSPGEMEKGDLESLREVGLGDVAIHDVVQVCALFNYYNRLADGLGIDPEPEWLDAARD